MQNLNLGGLEIPINGATKTFAILAKRGAGKTYSAGVMAEEFSKNNIPFVVFDPIDVWWGLRLNKNGKDKGLPVVVFGLEHADIPLTREMGREIARAVVKENISCVISTFGMPKVGMRHLIAEFAEELLNINNTPRHIFIEEAHEFVPQRIQGAGAKCFSAVESLVVMGRNRGIGVTLINQRAATINKDVLTQLDTLIALRNVGPQDRKALKDWVEFHTAEGDFEKFMDSLPSLPTGEAWVWSPEFMGIFERIKIRTRETFHPDREKLGHNFEMPKLDSVDIESFISKFKQGLEKTKEPNKKEKKPVVEELHNFVQEKTTESIITLKNEYESRLVEKDTEIRTLKSDVNHLQNIIRKVSESIGASDGEPVTLSLIVDESNQILQKMGGMPRKVYDTLLKHRNGLTKRQIALMCGYSVTSGSFSNAISKLMTMGLIQRDGEIYKALLK
jgi:uncharacterized protein